MLDVRLCMFPDPDFAVDSELVGIPELSIEVVGNSWRTSSGSEDIDGTEPP